MGNYVGAIRPAINRSTEHASSFYFIADYHAVTSVHKRDELNEYVYDVAATWLACGLDPEQTVFYRQSRIRETFELAWVLSCFTAKGLMNRAHAYKALVDKNTQEKGNDPDKGINMGVYSYPVLMAADILLFNSNIVPVGKDQVQHVEIARDIAQVFNHTYNSEALTLPDYSLVGEGEVVPGLDGRKMSKSYNNTIPLFCEEKRLEKLIKQIKTDSKGVDEPKDPGTCPLYQLATHFMPNDELQQLRADYATGIGYGHIKMRLFSAANDVLSEPREKYNHLMENRDEVEAFLQAGEAKAAVIAQQTMDRVRETLGIA